MSRPISLPLRYPCQVLMGGTALKISEVTISFLHIEQNLSKIRVSEYSTIDQETAMTKPTVQDLLKRINYIEADIDIQKQILFAIPSDQLAEMEKTIALIAVKKKEIEELRQQIRELDPEEHSRIVAFEEAVAQFKQLAASRKFTSITGRNLGENCALALYNGSEVECLIKACDESGDWTIITLDGKLQQYPKMAVAEKPVQSPIH